MKKLLKDQLYKKRCINAQWIFNNGTHWAFDDGINQTDSQILINFIESSRAVDKIRNLINPR